MSRAGEAPWLDAGDVAAVGRALVDLGWLEAPEALAAVERAGQGNMNLVLRVRDRAGRTAVLKQARPWVEKYPDIEAPADRIRVETAFYRTVAPWTPVAAAMPALLAADDAAYLALFEDLGTGTDCTDWYARPERCRPGDLAALGSWLGALHRESPPDAALLANDAMRALNHAHVFELPFADEPVVDLEHIAPGLAALRAPFLAPPVRAALAAAGARYRASAAAGDRLLHGDFYPGSWLRTDTGLAVIDPEFGFVGPPEFDVAVALAHLDLAGVPGPLHVAFEHAWSSAAGTVPERVDRDLVQRFRGIEIARRILGVAQLPLGPDLARRRALLAHALDCITGGDGAP